MLRYPAAGFKKNSAAIDAATNTAATHGAEAADSNSKEQVHHNAAKKMKHHSTIQPISESF